MTGLAEILARGTGHIYCMGIGGFGMAGLAALLKARGFEVSGSDLVESRLTGWVRRQGVPVELEHRPDHIHPDTVCLVRSSAVPKDHEVLRRAEALNTPVFLRGETLAALTGAYSTVAVAGTHGKTTTSAMIAQLLTSTGLDPGFCIGGEIDVLGGVAGAGAGKLMVVEADESDGTLVHYRPQHAVITNIEFDHMEYFEDEAAFLDCFRRFADRTDGPIYYCGDNKHARALCQPRSLSVSYGFGLDSEFRGVVVEESFDSMAFDAYRGDRELGRVNLSVPGRHNALNALAAMAVGFEHGLSFDENRSGLEAFRPARRRFDTFVGSNGVTVVSDYAHHPTEIRAVIRTALLRSSRRVVAVFQPHRYSRTLQLRSEFPPAFEGVDELWLTPVYEASEKPMAGGTTDDLFDEFIRFGNRGVHQAASPAAAWETVKNNLTEGDLFLILGAGDVEVIWAMAKAEWAS